MFLKEYSNTTRTAINFVKALNVQVNAAEKISVSDIDKIPIPFIAQLNYPFETVFTVVTSVSDDVVICYSNEKRKYISQGRN